MRQTDVAYVAGFFDGEGSIVISMNKYMRLEVGVSQKHTAVLLWMRGIFGGKIYQSEGYAAQWKIHGAKAIEFLMLIKPFLIEKAVDAEEAIVIWDARHDTITARKLLADRKKRRDERYQ